MNRLFVVAVVAVLSCGGIVRGAVSFSESFGGATLNSQLFVTASSSAYTAGPLVLGQTWQLGKGAGTTTGAVEIKTNFKVVGNFTVDLSVDSTNVGTGELGFRFGEFWTYPIAELFFQGPDGGEQTEYVAGGYGIAGFGVDRHTSTLRMQRTGNQIRSFANGHLFAIADYAGTDRISIFLRPNSGNGGFDPTVGKADAHFGVLDQFTLTADAFVPEPGSAMLAGTAIVLVITARMRRK